MPLVGTHRLWIPESWEHFAVAHFSAVTLTQNGFRASYFKGCRLVFNSLWASTQLTSV